MLKDMGVRDSKDLSAKQRKAIESWFLEQCEKRLVRWDRGY